MQSSFSGLPRTAVILAGTIMMSVILTLTAGCSQNPAQEKDAPGAKAPTKSSAAPAEQALGGEPKEQAGKEPAGSPPPSPKELKVHFLDVGQGDSILVQLPNNQVMLIDAGSQPDGVFVADYLKQVGVQKIDYLIGTHPHEDHLGGLGAVLASFKIGKVYLPQIGGSNKANDSAQGVLQAQKLAVTAAKAGISLLETVDIKVMMLGPIGSSYTNVNNYSAVIKITFGETAFLLAGDAESLEETDLVKSGADLKADVLKSGFHGGSSASTSQFLKAVTPKFVILSVGAGNPFGHPHLATLSRISDAKAKLLRTDQDGTLIFSSNGKELTFTKSSLRHPN